MRHTFIISADAVLVELKNMSTLPSSFTEWKDRVEIITP